MNYITEDCHYISNRDNLHVLDRVITANEQTIIAVPNINQAIRLTNQNQNTLPIHAYPRKDVNVTKSNITIFTYKSLLEYIIHPYDKKINLSKIVFANCSEITDPIYNREWELIIMLLHNSQFFFLYFCADDVCITRFIRWLYTLSPKKRVIKDINQSMNQIHMRYVNGTIDTFQHRINNTCIQKSSIEPLIHCLESKKLFPVALINFSQKTAEHIVSQLMKTRSIVLPTAILGDIDQWIATHIHPEVQTLHEFINIRQMIQVGIVYYHGSILQPIRELIEYCTIMKYIRILSCTDAFPTNRYDQIKTVVIMDYKRFDGQSFVNISPMIFKKQTMHAACVVQCIDNAHRIRTCHKLKNTSNKFIKNNTLFTSVNILGLLSMMDMPAVFQFMLYKSFTPMDKNFIDYTLNQMSLSGTLCNVNSPTRNHIIYKITQYGYVVSQFTCFSNPMEHFDCRVIEPHMIPFIKNTAVILMKEYNIRPALVPIIQGIIHDILEKDNKISLMILETLCENHMVRLATLHSLFIRICNVSDVVYKTHTNIEIPSFYNNLKNLINTTYFDIDALL
jgi:hypothetical protein